MGKCRYLKCLGHKRTFAVRKRASSKSRTCRHEDGTSGPLCACTLLSVPAQAETIQMVVENIAFVTAEVNAWVNKDNFAHTATAMSGDWNVSLAPKQNGKVELTKSGATDYLCKFP